MRLTQQQIEVLKRVGQEVFGAVPDLKLFGSRVDDNQSGGDIDLYVTGFNRSVEHQLDAKLAFLVKVKQEIGEQRIDLIFAPLPGQDFLPIQQIAEQTGILL